MGSVGGGLVGGKVLRGLARRVFVSGVRYARDGGLTDLRLRMRGIFGLSQESFC